MSKKDKFIIDDWIKEFANLTKNIYSVKTDLSISINTIKRIQLLESNASLLSLDSLLRFLNFNDSDLNQKIDYTSFRKSINEENIKNYYFILFFKDPSSDENNYIINKLLDYLYVKTIIHSPGIENIINNEIFKFITNFLLIQLENINYSNRNLYFSICKYIIKYMYYHQEYNHIVAFISTKYFNEEYLKSVYSGPYSIEFEVKISFKIISSYIFLNNYDEAHKLILKLVQEKPMLNEHRPFCVSEVLYFKYKYNKTSKELDNLKAIFLNTLSDIFMQEEGDGAAKYFNDTFYRMLFLSPYLLSVIKQGKRIYHYTNLNAVVSILNNKEIWATENSYLNDFEEFKHSDKTGVFNNFFVSSSSLSPDSAALWRSYCSDNGYQIELNPEKLELLLNNNYYFLRNRKKLPYNFFMHGEIMYLTKEEKDAEIEKMKNTIKNDLESINLEEQIIDKIINLHIDVLSAFIKEPTMEIENEYRLLFAKSEDDTEVDVRVQHGLIIPYIKVSFNVIDCIKSIWIGPLNSNRDSKKALRNFLNLINGNNIKIKKSKITWRY